MMRALTILQPWAHLVATGVKRVENRNWPTHFRGPLAIHAGKGKKCYDVDPNAWQDRYGVRMPPVDEVTFGAILGVAELIACVPVDDLAREFPDLADSPFAEGPFCWVLKDVRRLDEPFACNGALQLWTPPDQIMPKLLAASGLAGPIN